MAKKKISNDYPFYGALRAYYLEFKPNIRRYYKDLTKKILDYNDKSINSHTFLREPQFEALEMYVFIKEYLNNEKMFNLFAEWYHHKGKFAGRSAFSRKQLTEESSVQGSLWDDITREVYEDVFDMLKSQDQAYPNYIYALTMGTGKTILMATCIFYEFLLANKFPKDPRFCHNALVFAPDMTVLQSLKEIQTFDFHRVIPSEYANFLSSNIKFHFLDDSSTTLNTIDGSDFNIIISNAQKIILKEVHKDKSPVDQLMNDSLQLDLGLGEEFSKKIYGDLDSVKDEKEVMVNQRFEKLTRLPQLGVYVDEAHHLFGTDLKSSLTDLSKTTSLRYTINQIAKRLELQATKLVACYNYTGTPYVDNKVLPEVVYSYGLKEAIDNRFLKKVKIEGYSNVKNEEFLRKILEDFFKYYGDNLYEGLKPKIAIFGASIDELVNDIKPVVEEVLGDLGIDLNTILVNVGDQKYTKDKDILDFNNLDVIGSDGSKKQVLLLVNKGKEGWNCRSLFAVALYRSPSSKIFVLQSTMRCLRSITDIQQTAHVYLSNDNYVTLDAELKKNFNIDINVIKKAGNDGKIDYAVRIIPPVPNIHLEELHKTYDLILNQIDNSKFKINLDTIDLEKYKSKKIVKEGLTDKNSAREEEFVSSENIPYSKYSIVFALARYLNESPLKIEKILENSGEFDKIQKLVSKYNDVLYEELLPSIIEFLYTVKDNITTSSKEVPLIKYRDKTDHFTFHAKPNMTVSVNDPEVNDVKTKSFHTDRYCFDSKPERDLFFDLINRKDVDKVYFTGMFTGSENGLAVQYIDPESNIIRNYYPDFLVIYKNGTKQVIEVKGDNKIDDEEVKAKAYAAIELSDKSHMDYEMIKSSDIEKGKFKDE